MKGTTIGVVGGIPSIQSATIFDADKRDDDPISEDTKGTREREKKNGLKCRDGDDDGMPSTTAAHRNEIIIRHDRSRDKDKRLFRH